VHGVYFVLASYHHISYHLIQLPTYWRLYTPTFLFHIIVYMFKLKSHLIWFMLHVYVPAVIAGHHRHRGQWRNASDLEDVVNSL
jgi:hypothetical protein